ncbi:MAG: site-specific DNA-methyltransferase [Deltaproteobacteria bacterium]|nr:site-specific DNA-methyltransferase [Deltaproteobacteria bacterium]
MSANARALRVDAPVFADPNRTLIPGGDRPAPAADAPQGAHKVIPAMNHVYQGDSIGMMRSWEDRLFHATITDPPYNVAANRKGLAWAFSSHVTLDESWDRFTQDEYEAFTRAWLTEVCRVTRENGNIFIFGSYHNIYTIGAIARQMKLRIVNSIIWAKPNAQPNITCRMFTESTEQILWLCNNREDKAKNWTFNYHDMKEMNGGKQMRNFWEIPLTPPRERGHGKHPSQKPLRLLERLVLAGTHESDRVLDCFMGSGTTALASEIHRRHWVGIERDDAYCRMTRDRIMEWRNQKQIPR